MAHLSFPSVRLTLRRGVLPRTTLRSDAFCAKVADDGDATVLALYGELDIAAAQEAEQALAIAESSGNERVIVDLGGLWFMDVTGLHLVLAAHERLGDRLTLLRGRHSVHHVFELTKTTACLPFED